MNRLINTLPIEVINIILSYSYNIQSKELQKDIISYFQTKDIIYNIFYNRYHTLISIDKNAIFKHFQFHIASYIKGVENMYSYDDTYYYDDMLKDYIKRSFMLKDSSNSVIFEYEKNMYKNTKTSRFRFYWGLLKPEERNIFIDIQKKMDINRMP